MQDVILELAHYIPTRELVNLIITSSSFSYILTKSLLHRLSREYKLPVADTLDELALYSKSGREFLLDEAIRKNDTYYVGNYLPYPSIKDVKKIIKEGTLEMIDVITTIVSSQEFSVGKIVKDKRIDIIDILYNNGWKSSKISLQTLSKLKIYIS